MKHKYCPHCGEFLTKKETGDEGLVPYCLKCEKFVFDSAEPCVILLILNELNQVCVIKQSYGRDIPVLVAGYIKLGATAEETIICETKEEIGHDVLSYEYVNSYFHERSEALMLGYIVRVNKQEFKLSTELREAHWVSIEEAGLLLKDATTAIKLYNDCVKKGLI